MLKLVLFRHSFFFFISLFQFIRLDEIQNFELNTLEILTWNYVQLNYYLKKKKIRQKNYLGENDSCISIELNIFY